MTTLSFSSIKFQDSPGSRQITLRFMKLFEMHIPRADLESIGPTHTDNGDLIIDADQKLIDRKFPQLLDKAFHDLESTLTRRQAIYIHRNSGIPLIGSMAFGIVDRGTNMIELKPITGCNLDCTFCSVDEPSKRNQVDFIVEADYLVEETRNLIDFKSKNKKPDQPEDRYDIFVNPHGEPLLYSDIVLLIKGLRQIPQVKDISIITNGSILTRSLADELIDAGLTQVNISINAMDPTVARNLSGNPGYSIENIMDICTYVSKKIRLIVAPVWIRDSNDGEIPKIINFAKAIKAKVGIQNYLVHRRGRKVAKQVPWEDFYKQLKVWEKETDTDLHTLEHTLFKTATYPKPFMKGTVVRVEILSPGRTEDEAIAAAKGRSITVVNCTKDHGSIKVRILKDKDNIFMGEAV